VEGNWAGLGQSAEFSDAGAHFPYPSVRGRLSGADTGSVIGRRCDLCSGSREKKKNSKMKSKDNEVKRRGTIIEERVVKYEKINIIMWPAAKLVERRMTKVKGRIQKEKSSIIGRMMKRA